MLSGFSMFGVAVGVFFGAGEAVTGLGAGGHALNSQLGATLAT